MSLVKWKNSDVFPSITEWMDDFFDKDFFPFQSKLAKMGTLVPAVNIKETKENYAFEVAIPGVNKEDLNLSIKNGLLTISSEKKEEKEDKKEDYTRREFSFNSFSRSFSLPDHIDEDKIQASYDKGVLNLLIPKKEVNEDHKNKKIEIS